MIVMIDGKVVSCFFPAHSKGSEATGQAYERLRNSLLTREKMCCFPGIPEKIVRNLDGSLYYAIL